MGSRFFVQQWFTAVILSFGILALTNIPSVTTERILFLLPMASKSMANVFEPIAKGLANRGHELTLVTPVRFEIDKKSETGKDTNVTHLIPIPVEEFLRDYPDPIETRQQAKIYSFPVPLIEHCCHKLFQNDEFMKKMNEKFDLIVLNIFYSDCLAGIIHKIGSPVILVGTIPFPSRYTELHVNPMPSSIVPYPMFGDIGNGMNFIQRTKNFLYNVYFHVMLEVWTRPPQEKIYRQYLGQDIPSIWEVFQKQVSMLLINSHFSITFPRPLMPSVVEIGGIHCLPAKTLPKDLKDFVEGGKEGFILFSLGSIVQPKKLPESVRIAFVKTFAKLKQRVIWKWETDGGMEDKPENVMLAKWLPQQDLLGHPNIRLFITHGGLLSTEEAVYHGVPLLGLPVFIDQDANMNHADSTGLGIKMELLDLTESKLETQIRKLLDDSRYMQKAKELSNIFRDQPQTPLERALYWTEYVMRHKGAYHLVSPGKDLNMIQYYSLDVILLLIVVSLVIVALIGFLLRCIFVGLNSLFYKQNISQSKAGNKRKRL